MSPPPLAHIRHLCTTARTKSGSVCQWYRSVNLDSYQIVTDPQHWQKEHNSSSERSVKWYGTIRIRNQIRIRNSVVLIRGSGSLPKCHRSSTLANRTPFSHQQECQIVLVGSGTCARGVPLLPTPPFHHKNNCKLVTIMINSEHTLKLIHFACTTAGSVAFLSDHISPVIVFASTCSMLSANCYLVAEKIIPLSMQLAYWGVGGGGVLSGTNLPAAELKFFFCHGGFSLSPKV